jgi:SAM-dependent methyltransferase
MRQLMGYVRKRIFLKNWSGYCLICQSKTRFFAHGKWYREQLHCGRCGCIARERGLMRVIQSLYPEWRKAAIHESSPGGRGTSLKLARECLQYTSSQYMPELAPGSLSEGGHVAQDLEAQTFADSSFDLVISQDVFEHLFHPDRAIQEIVRTLKPGGAHIMTVPIARQDEHSVRRATIDSGKIVHLQDPQYHGNPVGDGTSLVTIDWGYDIADYLTRMSGCPTTIYVIDSLREGICEEIEVVVTRKPASTAPDWGE